MKYRINFLYMDSVYLINLEKRKDRLKNATKMLKERGILNFKRFNAIDGKKISDNEFKKVLSEESYKHIKDNKRKSHDQLTEGAVGCALSHIALWEKLIISNNYEAITIFEDDIYLVENFYDIVNTVLQNQNDFDMLLFFSRCPFDNKCYDNASDIIDKSEGKCTMNVTYQNNIVPYNINCDNKNAILSKYKLKRVLYSWGLLGYIITKNCAKKLLKNVFPLNKQIDHYISDRIVKDNLKILAIKPNIVMLNPLTSRTDIQTDCSDCEKTIRVLKKNNIFLYLFLIAIIMVFLYFLYIKNRIYYKILI